MNRRAEMGDKNERKNELKMRPKTNQISGETAPMKKTAKKMLAIGILLIFSFTLFVSAAHQTTPIRIQLYYHHDFLFAGYYAALHQGYYHDANLDVQFIEGNSTTNIGEEMFRTGAEFGIASRDGLKTARTEGYDIKAVAAVYQKSPVVFTMLANSIVKTPKDFAGKTIGIRSELSRAVIERVLENVRVPRNEVKIVNIEENAQYFYNDTVDVFAGSFFGLPVTAKLEGHDLHIIEAADYGIDDHGGLILASTQFIKEDPKMVQNFVDASLNGWKYALDHPAEVAEYVFEYDNRTTLQRAEETAKLLPAFLFHHGYFGCLDGAGTEEDQWYDHTFVKERCRAVYFLGGEDRSFLILTMFIFLLIFLLPAWLMLRRKIKSNRKKER